MQYFYSLGIGGKGIIPGRPLDRFGIGYYYLDIKSPTFTVTPGIGEILRDEYGMEAYYNIAITPWMQLSPDVQVIRPTQRNVINTSGVIPSRDSVGTVTVLSLRAKLVF
jgi:porin